MAIKLKQITVDSQLDMNNFKIVNVKDPENDNDAVNLQTLREIISQSGTTSGSTNSLNDLNDVDISNLNNYDVLMFSGGTWVNTKDIILPNDAKIHIGDWRISELTGNLKIEKNIGGEWKSSAEFFV